MRLGDLPSGSRLLIRSKVDWRFAAVVRTVEETVVISVASPRGRNYRVRRGVESIVKIEGSVHFLTSEVADRWRDNFTTYDTRW